MVEKASQQLLTTIGLTKQPYTPSEIKSLEDYVVTEIDKIKLQLLTVDVLICNHLDEALDGNIRIVFEK
jgi:hypothetical protein